MSAQPRRSALYLPASNARAIAKARTLAADVVILDLEDAVAPEAKPDARAAAAAALAEGYGGRERVLRVNALATAWGADDLAAAGAADAVLLPKVDAPEDVARAAALLPAHVRLWAMVETCVAIGRVEAIAAAGARLDVLVLGLNDLAAELRARPGADRAPLLPAVARTVAAARANGLAVLDGVCNALGDPMRLEAEARQGRAFGCDGKTLIHPEQIAIANAVFAPDADELAWADAVIAAFDDPAQAGRGALRVNGAMVERLHLAEARRLRTLAATIADRTAVHGG